MYHRCTTDTLQVLLSLFIPSYLHTLVESLLKHSVNILEYIFISILQIANHLCMCTQKKRRAGGKEKWNIFSSLAHFSVPFLRCLDFQDSVLAFSVHPTTEISFSVERRRAREEQAVAVNKMFYQENSTVGNQQATHYSVIAQVKKVCEVVDGFIYVANAEAHRGKGFLFIFCE